MFTGYVLEAMSKAVVEKINDPQPYFASIPGFKGVFGQGSTRKEALSQLQEVLEEWLILKVSKQQFVPSVKGYDFNALLATA